MSISTLLKLKNIIHDNTNVLSIITILPESCTSLTDLIYYLYPHISQKRFKVLTEDACYVFICDFYF